MLVCLIAQKIHHHSIELVGVLEKHHVGTTFIGIEILDASGAPLQALEGVPPGSLIIARNQDTKMAEKYTVK